MRFNVFFSVFLCLYTAVYYQVKQFSSVSKKNIESFRANRREISSLEEGRWKRNAHFFATGLIYIYIFLVVSSRRVSLIWQWKESTVEKGGNMNNYARFGSIFFFFTLTRADHYICSKIQNRWKSYLTLVYDLRFFFVFLSVFCSQLRL